MIMDKGTYAVIVAATIAQQPKEMGRLAIKMGVKLLDGEEVEAFIPVPLELITE